MELFECLPKIEHLTFLDSFMGALLVASVPEEVPTLLTHLKYACVDEMYVDRNGLTFLGVLIKCSPNLEKLKIIPHGECSSMNYANIVGYSAILDKYSDVWLEHLVELEIEYFSNLEIELDFVKFILVRSPKLKKVILLTSKLNKDEELKMLKNLLCAPRASPVEIVLCHIK